MVPGGVNFDVVMFFVRRRDPGSSKYGNLTCENGRGLAVGRPSDGYPLLSGAPIGYSGEIMVKFR